MLSGVADIIDTHHVALTVADVDVLALVLAVASTRPACQRQRFQAPRQSPPPDPKN